MKACVVAIVDSPLELEEVLRAKAGAKTGVLDAVKVRGTGFVCDKQEGLVVTAGHVVQVWSDAYKKLSPDQRRTFSPPKILTFVPGKQVSGQTRWSIQVRNTCRLCHE